MRALWSVICFAGAAICVAGSAEASSWSGPEGGADRARRAGGPAGLSEPVVRWRVGLGGRVSHGSLLTTDLDGDGAVDFAVLGGGRVTAYGTDGRALWRSSALDATSLGGAFDFDGDGRREVVVIGRYAVHLIDAVTGVWRWTSPEEPFATIGVVGAADVDGDQLFELFVSDRACGTRNGGRGPTVFFGFGDGGARQLGRAHNPREYICGRWQTLADVNGDGASELIVPDMRQVHGFDPLTGERRFEGADVGPLPFGIFPHRVVDIDGDGDDEIIGFVDYPGGARFPPRRTVMALDWSGGAIGAVWTHDLADDARLDGGTASFAHIDGDARLDVVFSFFDPTSNRWSIRALSGGDGAVLWSWPALRLVGAVELDGDGRPEFVVRRGDPAVPGRFGIVAVHELDGVERYRVEGADLVLDRAGIERVRDTPDIAAPPAVFGGSVEAQPQSSRHLLFRRDLDGDGLEDVLERIDERGEVRASLALRGQPGASAITRAPVEPGGPARPEGWLVLATADGGIGIYDANLDRWNDADGDGVADVRVSSGLGWVAAGDLLGDGRARPVVVASGGQLTALDVNGSALWTVLQKGGGSPTLGNLVSGASTEVVALDQQVPAEVAWVVLDGRDGALHWRHARSSADWTARGSPLVVDVDADGDADLLRVDGARADPFDSVVAALDGATGEFIWETVLPFLDGPAATMSAVDADGDGFDEIYVPVGRRVYRLAPTTGEIIGQVDLAHPTRVVRATGGMPPLLLSGGSGPLQMLDAALGVAWVAEVDGPPAAWDGRTAVAVGDAVWATPGAGEPLHVFALADGMVRGRHGYRDGMPIDEETAELPWATVVPDLIGDGADGVLVAGGDGVLYALAADGTPAWVRTFGAALGDPAVADVDGDGRVEVLVPAADGTLALVDHSGVPAVAAVWDNDGLRPADGADGDVDAIALGAAFGADWSSVDGADGYDVRVVSAEGLEIRPWMPVGAGRFVRFDGLPLVPGRAYATQVRAWRHAANGPERSEPRTSDGVRVVDGRAPVVTLELSEEAFAPALAGLIVDAAASDDDQLAGWKLAVEQLDGVLVTRLASEALAGVDAVRQLEWDGRRLDGEPVASGAYVMSASFFDRAGNGARVERAFAVCADDAVATRGEDPRCVVRFAPDAALPPLPPDDAGLVDAAAPDAQRPDVAVLDSTVPDSAVPDSAVPDSAVPDSAVPDGAVPDSTVPDSAVPDSAVPDAGTDSTAPDARESDAGLVDAGAPSSDAAADMGVSADDATALGMADGAPTADLEERVGGRASGCGCRTGDRSPVGGGLLLLVLVAVSRPGRRRVLVTSRRRSGCGRSSAVL